MYGLNAAHPLHVMFTNRTPPAVTSEERNRYTAIIDGILETADLETISRKKIRQGLEAELGGKDLTDQKVRKRNTATAKLPTMAAARTVSESASGC